MTTENTYKELINIAFKVKDSSVELLNRAIQGNKQALDFLESKIGERLADIPEKENSGKIALMPTIKIDGKEFDFNIGESIN